MNTPRLRRRTILGGGIGAGLASLFLRPLVSAAADGPPTRFLLVHKPCGTILNRFFPTRGTETDFTLGPITAAFEPFKKEMVIFDNLTAPRDGGWQGDRHGAGLISCTTGSRAISDGTPVDGDDQFHNLTAASASVDQLIATQSPKTKGTKVASVYLGAYRDSVRNGRLYPANGAPNFRAVSFAGPNMPLFPEVRPDIAVQNLFGGVMPGGAAAVARQQQMRKSILDLMAKDIGKLQKLVPSSERPKLDAHLTAIQQLEAQLATMPGVGQANCMPPAVLPLLTTVPAGTRAGVRIDAVDYQKLAIEQLATIKVAFQCDLTRVASFSYGHGNCDVQFGAILPNVSTLTGFHDISHLTDAGAVDQLAAVDTWYCQQLAAFLMELKSTPEVDGSSMLDNTLVVFFSDVSIGNNHDWRRMPVIFFGGKSLGLRQGRWIDMKGQYMNDLWASTLSAFGYQLPADNKFAGYNVWKGVTGQRLGNGAISGIFG